MLDRNLARRRDLHAEDAGDTGLGHGDAVPDRGGFHRGGVVGDDDHLGPLPKIAQEVREALDIRAVKGGVHFVQNAEGAGLDVEEGEQEGSSG